MRRILFPLALCVACGSAAQAAELDINLNDETGKVMFRSPTDGFGMQNGRVGVGVLFNEDDDIIGELSLESIGRVSESLRFNVGVKGYVGELDDADETLTAIGIGGGVRFSLASTVPLSLALNGFIAPDILSFGDPTGVREFDATVEAEFARNAAAYVGYGYMEVKLDGPDAEVRDGAIVGVRLSF